MFCKAKWNPQTVSGLLHMELCCVAVISASRKRNLNEFLFLVTSVCLSCNHVLLSSQNGTQFVWILLIWVKFICLRPKPTWEDQGIRHHSPVCLLKYSSTRILYSQSWCNLHWINRGRDNQRSIWIVLVQSFSKRKSITSIMIVNFPHSSRQS